MTTDLVAILVTDMVGSTAVRASLGEEQADRLQHAHDALLRDAVAATRGDLVKGTGDGIMATYRSASDALLAAVSIQRRFESYSRSSAAVAPIVARIGIAAGDVAYQDGDIFGSAVVEATRLCAAAGNGRIFCSDLVRALARGRGSVKFDAVGDLELKGLPDPVATCEVRWDPVGDEEVAGLELPEELSPKGWMRFVGRHQEVHDTVGRVLTCDRAEALWVLGEPGAGKSRFAAEVAQATLAAGAMVLFGRCDQQVRDPYQPIIQALRWFVGQIDGDALGGRLGTDPAPLVRLVPEIGTRLPSLLEEVGRVTEVEQLRLFDSVRSWLTNAAPGRPLLLVVDDVHWADRPTLALLAHVLRSTTTASLFVLATARDTTPDSSQPLAELVDELARTGRSRTASLGGLTAEQVSALMWDLELDTAEPALLADRIAVETAGNPLFVTAVLAGMSAGDVGGETALPSDVQAAVRHRVRRLEDSAQDLLAVAALVGHAFSLTVVAEATGRAEEDCLSIVEAAVGSGLIDEVGVDQFRFTHAVVREVLAGELSISRRARVHRSIAEAIERTPGFDAAENLRALAMHWAATGAAVDAGRALEYVRRSAARAIDQLAFDAAADDLAFAIDLAARTDPPLAGLRHELLVARGKALMMAGRHQLALDAFFAAAELARDRRDWMSFARAAVDYEEASWRPGLPGDVALGLLEEAAAHDLGPTLGVRVRASLARAMQFCGRPGVAQQMAEEVLLAARATGDPRLIFHALDACISSLPFDRPFDHASLTALAEEALDLADRLEELSTGVLAAVASGVEASLAAGDQDSADRWLEATEGVADRTGSRFDRYVMMSMRQMRSFCAADLETAEAQAHELLEFGRRLGEDVSGTHGVQMFLIRREQGRLGELDGTIRTLLRLNPTDAMWRPGLVALLVEIGMADEALELLEQYCASSFDHLPRDGMYAGALCLLAEASARLDSRDAGALLDRLLAIWAGTVMSLGITVGILGPADRYRGLLARMSGRLDEADKHFTDASRLNQTLRSPVWTAHTLADHADLYRTTGNPNARVLAERALEVAARHGLLAVTRQLAWADA